MSDTSLQGQFSRVARRFRAIQADNPTDGSFYVRQHAADAGCLLKQAVDGGYLDIDISWPEQPQTMAADAWAAAWAAGVVCISRPRPSLLMLREVDRGEGIVVRALDSKDWRERALSYAEVCEALADVTEATAASRNKETKRGKAGRPTTIDADRELLEEFERGQKEREWETQAQFAEQKGMGEDTLSKKLKRAREVREAQNGENS